MDQPVRRPAYASGRLQTSRIAQCTRLLPIEQLEAFCAAILVSQRRQPSSTYLPRFADALTIREKAYSNHAGVAASGTYAEVAARPISLAEQALSEMPSQKLASFPHSAGRWHVLSLLFADPRQLQTDAL